MSETSRMAKSERQSQADTVSLVAASILDGIRDGRLAPGQRLHEADLARDLGCGRNAIREAMQRLCTEGVLVARRNYGPSVRHFSRGEIAELFEVREVLEGLAARRCANRRGAADNVEELSAINAQLRSAAAVNGIEHAVQLNGRFHGWIMARAGGTRIQSLADQLSLQVFRLQFRTLLSVGNMERSWHEHERIVAAIAGGDPDAAEQAMRAHVRRSGSEVQTLPDTLFAREPPSASTNRE